MKAETAFVVTLSCIMVVDRDWYDLVWGLAATEGEYVDPDKAEKQYQYENHVEIFFVLF